MAVAFGVLKAGLSLVLRHGNQTPKYALVTRSSKQLTQNCERCFSTFSDQKVERLFSEVNIEIKGNDEAVLDSYMKFMRKAAECLSIDANSVVLPRHVERYTVLKSPHIYKKHRVQYEIRTHRLLVRLKEITEATSDVFLEYVQRNCPEGVSMDVKHVELEELLVNIPPEAQAFLKRQEKKSEA